MTAQARQASLFLDVLTGLLKAVIRATMPNSASTHRPTIMAQAIAHTRCPFQDGAAPKL